MKGRDVQHNNRDNGENRNGQKHTHNTPDGAPEYYHQNDHKGVQVDFVSHQVGLQQVTFNKLSYRESDEDTYKHTCFPRGKVPECEGEGEADNVSNIW